MAVEHWLIHAEENKQVWMFRHWSIGTNLLLIEVKILGVLLYRKVIIDTIYFKEIEIIFKCVLHKETINVWVDRYNYPDLKLAQCIYISKYQML